MQFRRAVKTAWNPISHIRCTTHIYCSVSYRIVLYALVLYCILLWYGMYRTVCGYLFVLYLFLLFLFDFSSSRLCCFPATSKSRHVIVLVASCRCDQNNICNLMWNTGHSHLNLHGCYIFLSLCWSRLENNLPYSRI